MPWLKRRVAWSLAGLLAVAVGGAAWASASRADTSDDASTAAVNGYLFSAGGQPKTTGSVVLYLSDTDSAGNDESVPLQRVTPGADGGFSFQVETDSLARDADGGIALELGYAGDSAHGLMDDFRLVNDGSGWVMDLPSGTLEENPAGAPPLAPIFQLGAGTIDAAASIPPEIARALRHTPVTTPGGSVVGPNAKDLKRRVKKGARGLGNESVVASGSVVIGSGGSGIAEPDQGVDNEPDTLDPQAKTTCDGVMPVDAPTRIVWQGTGATKYRFVPTKLIITKSLSSQRWTLKRTNETTMTPMENVGGERFSGSFTASRTQSSSLTFTPIVHNNQSRLFEVEWEFGEERAHCDYVSVTSPPQDEPAIDLWRWLPWTVKAGSLLEDTDLDFACGGPGLRYNAPFANTTSIGTESDVVYEEMFSIKGIGLDSEQKDEASETFKVIPDDSANPAWLCGNNADPGTAALVKEVRE